MTPTSEHFRPRCAPPRDLAVPVAVDPGGRLGPTRGQAGGSGWRRTSPGLYVPSGAARSVEQRLLEQSRRLRAGGVVGGWGSLRLHGAAYFDGILPDGGERPVTLVVPRPGNLAPLPGSHVVRARRAPTVVWRHGVPCEPPLDAVVREVAAAPGLWAAVTLLDMALAARVVSTTELGEAAAGSVPGVARLRSALPWCDERPLSPRETWLRLVWRIVADLPPPRCNWPVTDVEGAVLGSPDLVHGGLGLVAEYDGSAHLQRARRRRDVRRYEAFRDVGLEVVDVVSSRPGEERAVAERLVSAVRRRERSSLPRRWVLAPEQPPPRLPGS